MRLILMMLKLGSSIAAILTMAHYLDYTRTEALVGVVFAVLVQIALILDELVEVAKLNAEMHLIHLELKSRSSDDGK